MKATRKATVEEYMEYVDNVDFDGCAKYISECFGSHEDYDNEAAVAFAEEVKPLIEQKVNEMINEAPEATPEMIEAAKAQVAAEETKAEEVKVDTTKEAANDEDTDKAANDEGEATPAAE